MSDIEKKRREGDFQRVLGPWTAGALIAGCMIGTGIFIFVSDVALNLQSPGLILSAWLVGAAVAACGALCLAELAAAYPETGGIYVFLRRAFGAPVAFLYSWAEIPIMRAGSLAILVVAFGNFTCEFLGVSSETSAWMGKTMAVGAIVFLTVVNMAGVRLGGGIQNVLTVVKILCLAAIIAVGVLYAFGAFEPHPVVIEAPERPDKPLILLFGLALVAVMWTFGGWDEAPFVAEEVQNPERNLPLAILAGLALVGLLFVLTNAAYLMILSPEELAGSGGRTATAAMERALGGGAKKILSLALMISTFGAANGLLLTSGRLSYAVGRDQALFRWFASVHPGTKTPMRGLALQGILTIVVILILENPFSLLLYTGLAYWIFAGLTGAAVIVLRVKEPDRKRPFRVWVYPVTPVLFILTSVGMAYAVIEGSRSNALATLIILAVGAVVYAVQSLVFRKQS